jgi:hypothetical protein
LVPKKPATNRTLKIQEDLNEVVVLDTVFEPPPAPVHDPNPLLMDLLLEIRNELKELRHLYSANMGGEILKRLLPKKPRHLLGGIIVS